MDGSASGRGRYCFRSTVRLADGPDAPEPSRLRVCQPRGTGRRARLFLFHSGLLGLPGAALPGPPLPGRRADQQPSGAAEPCHNAGSVLNPE